MTKDSDILSERAEAQNDMTLIMTLNMYRSLVKDEELASLAREIAKLREELHKP